MTDVLTARFLLDHDRYLILTHIRPDGDTVGCAVALCHALREQGRTAYLLPDPDTTELFLPYLEGTLAPAGFVPDTVVAVDIASAGLIPDDARQYLDRIDLTIDHHPSQEYFAAQTCLDPTRAACGELVFDILSHFGPISPQVALPLYVAVSTDTGCFVYGNTTAATHRVAAALIETGIDYRKVNKDHFRTKTIRRLQLESLITAGMECFDGGEIAMVTLSLEMMAQVGATENDIDDISAFVGQISGVSTGITVRQLRPDQCKISLRTDPNHLNASKVCALLGGGGHAAAAGTTMDASVEEAKAAILAAVRTIQKGG